MRVSCFCRSSMVASRSIRPGAFSQPVVRNSVGSPELDPKHRTCDGVFCMIGPKFKTSLTGGGSSVGRARALP
jgi:hypothetical protein